MSKRVKDFPYKNCKIYIATKHQKSLALKPPFRDIVKAEVIEFLFDTDQFGTFTGEIARSGSQLEVARKKCEIAIKQTNAQFSVASEGSFGPHPGMPFIPVGMETMYFIDTQRDFHLHLSEFFTDTNYKIEEVGSLTELLKFAASVMFPSHALILRPYPRDNGEFIVKGIKDSIQLEKSFYDVLKHSAANKIVVETDMRAHMNPTRMRTLQTFAQKLATRLNSLCPKCEIPGWGKVAVELGLPCKVCGSETQELKAEICGCAKCSYKETIYSSQEQLYADPSRCSVCNP